MSFMIGRRTMGCKLENPAYSNNGETLTVADYNVPAYNIQYSPDVAFKQRKLARGDYNKGNSIAGKRPGTVSFSVDVAYSGAASTPPTYFKCLQACATKQTTGANVTLVPNSDYSNVPMTFEVVEKDEGATPAQLIFRLRGAMGNAKLVVDDVGNPCRIDFEFKGVTQSFADRAFANIINPTGFDAPLPEAVLGASIKLFNETMTLNKVTIDLGNDVQAFSDPSKGEGIMGCKVAGASPKLELDPDMDLIANRGIWARLTGNTTGAFSMEIGSHINVTAPAAQIVSAYKPGDREGHVVHSLSVELQRLSGNDALTITHA